MKFVYITINQKSLISVNNQNLHRSELGHSTIIKWPSKNTDIQNLSTKTLLIIPLLRIQPSFIVYHRTN